jgi:hypothetical protein
MNTQAIELKNKYEFIKLVLPHRFSPFIPEYDNGIDFILHRGDDNLHLNVQLKSRWTVEKKYFGRKIWIAFPGGNQVPQRDWYLVPHDLMVAHGQKLYGNTRSWERGGYNKGASAASWLKELAEYKIDTLLSDLTKEKANSTVGHATEWAMKEP